MRTSITNVFSIKRLQMNKVLVLHTTVIDISHVESMYKSLENNVNQLIPYYVSDTYIRML